MEETTATNETQPFLVRLVRPLETAVRVAFELHRGDAEGAGCGLAAWR